MISETKEKPTENRKHNNGIATRRGIEKRRGIQRRRRRDWNAIVGSIGSRLPTVRDGNGVAMRFPRDASRTTSETIGKEARSNFPVKGNARSKSRRLDGDSLYSDCPRVTNTMNEPNRILARRGAARITLRAESRRTRYRCVTRNTQGHFLGGRLDQVGKTQVCRVNLRSTDRAFRNVPDNASMRSKARRGGRRSASISTRRVE